MRFDELLEKKGVSSQKIGTYYTLCSALCYTVSLSVLRIMTNYPEVSSDWSIAVKEAVCCLLVLPFIAVRAFRGQYKFPAFGIFLALVLAGFLCEILGARPHLAAYAFLGLALVAPILQAGQLILASIIGATWLKERVTVSKIIALVTLVAAVFLLSQNNGEANKIAGQDMKIGLGLLCALCTSFGYCMQVSIMRRVIRIDEPAEEGKAVTKNNAERVPASYIMLVVTGVGVVACGLIFTCQHGFSAWTEPPAPCWIYVLIAGVFNAIGFYFQIESLRRLYLLKQSLVATAQTGALCLAGIFFFHESFGVMAVVGLILLAAGVFISTLSK